MRTSSFFYQKMRIDISRSVITLKATISFAKIEKDIIVYLDPIDRAVMVMDCAELLLLLLLGIQILWTCFEVSKNRG